MEGPYNRKAKTAATIPANQLGPTPGSCEKTKLNIALHSSVMCHNSEYLRLRLYPILIR